MFDIYGKVALVAGGASGIGLATVEQLLENGVKGVTVADINKENGNRIVEHLNKKYGKGKVLFAKVNVADRNEFEEAFKLTVKNFHNLDIVINSAGTINEQSWEEEIAVNLGGTVTGTYFAFEKYLPKYKTGSEGVIVNIASITGIDPFVYVPIYSATKSGVISLARTFGSPEHYQRNQVKVMTICPGYTKTSLLRSDSEYFLSTEFFDLRQLKNPKINLQSPESVATSVITVIKDGTNGSTWVSENDEAPYKIKFFSREESRI